MRVSKCVALMVILAPVLCVAMDTTPPPADPGEVVNGWTGASLLLLSEFMFRGVRSKRRLSWLWMVAKVADVVAEVANLVALGARHLAELGDKKLGQRLKKKKVTDAPEPQPENKIAP